MEISQLSTYNNQLQQSISLRLPRYALTIYYTSRSNQGRVRWLYMHKMVIHAHFTQNYDLQVFNIVQSYQSDLVHLGKDL